MSWTPERASYLTVDFPTLIPLQRSMESLQNPTKPFNTDIKSHLLPAGLLDEATPETSHNKVWSNYNVHPFLPFKGTLISPSPPGWHQSSQNHCFHFLLHGTAKEKNMEVDWESLLQPIMSVICPQIEERRDKESPSDATQSVESTFMHVCVSICVCN